MSAFHRVVSMADMLKFNATAYHEAMAALNRAIIISNVVERPPLAKTKKEIIDKDIRNIMIDATNMVKSGTIELRLPIARSFCEDCISGLESDQTWEWAHSQMATIDRVIRKELESVNLFLLDKDAIEFLAPNEPLFGSRVDIAMPSASNDIEEAGACFSLGRYTASAFHLMRVMEIGLRAASLCLGLPDPTGSDRNWGSILRAMKMNMESRAVNSNQGWKKGDKELFWEMHGSLDAVRSAWRNTTMHIERKYDKAEAFHLFQVVKHYMCRLSDRCDETGSSKA